MTDCQWCGGPVTPRDRGRPKAYCSVPCRRAQGRYLEKLPGWQADLAQLEQDAAKYPGGPPVYVRNLIAAVRAAIASHPRATR